MLALFVGISHTACLVAAMGILAGPLEAEFGWGRAQSMAGASLYALVMVPLIPFVGGLIDRLGARRVALPGQTLTILATSSLVLANGSTVQWLVLWGLMGLFASSLSMTVWTYSIVETFNKGRSMAMAVVLAGSTGAGAISPPFAQWLADSYGWRIAILGLSFGWGGLALLLCAIFLPRRARKPRQAASPRAPSTDAASIDLPGLTMAQAARCLALWRIGLATLIIFLLGAALVVHKAPILIEAGLSRRDAALLASLSGLAGVAGKLVTGWAMQRWDAGLVGGLSIGIMGLALGLLLEPFRTPATIVIAMMTVGFAGGSKLQIAAYLTSIYAGARNYGKIFGILATMTAVGGGLGPFLGGVIYDISGGYDLLVYIGVPASLLCVLLLARLGPYPDWNAPNSPAPV